VSRHEQHPHVGSKFTNLSRNGRPLHLRHYDVGEEKINRAVEGRGDLDRLHSVRGAQHLISAPDEQPSRHLAESLFVVDDQDRLGTVQFVTSTSILYQRRADESCTTTGRRMVIDVPTPSSE